MSNAFDFELVADDQVSDAINRIDGAVRKLLPQLQNTKDKLALGGQDTTDDLDNISRRLNLMARAARDNVQFIGDIVPPLKMVGELAGKVVSFGLAGAVGYGMKRVAESFADASREAWNLDVSAKNAGMRVDEFTRLSGAMRILGSDSQSANASVEGMFKTFNDALWGKNSTVLGAMSQIGAQIVRSKDGTADVLKTLESIARVFPSLSPENQKTAADALGLDANALQLLREGARLKELLAKSDQFGLTMDPGLNDQLKDMNGALNEVSASWDGLKKKLSTGMVLGKLNSIDGSIKDGLEGIADLFSNGDFTGLSHALGFVSSADAKKLRRIQGDKDLYNSLSRRERGAVDGGFYTDAVRRRYDAYYGAADAATQLQEDLAAIAPRKPTVRSPVSLRSTPYDRVEQYDDILQEAGDKYNVDPTILKAIMSQESGGDPLAVSRAGARGVMQVMPSNFPHTGVTDWTDPRQNIMAGAQIFAENMQRSRGDVALALRYYNGGYDRRRWGRENAAYPGAVLAHYRNLLQRNTPSAQKLPHRGTGSETPLAESARVIASQSSAFSAGTVASNSRRTTVSIIQPRNGTRASERENLASAMKAALEDQKIKLEITMTGSNGEKQTVETRNGGRISMPMFY
ncbi:lytic transglycosylase domain-containing protein [Salmonella enterica]